MKLCDNRLYYAPNDRAVKYAVQSEAVSAREGSEVIATAVRQRCYEEVWERGGWSSSAVATPRDGARALCHQTA